MYTYMYVFNPAPNSTACVVAQLTKSLQQTRDLFQYILGIWSKKAKMDMHCKACEAKEMRCHGCEVFSSNKD